MTDIYNTKDTTKKGRREAAEAGSKSPVSSPPRPRLLGLSPFDTVCILMLLTLLALFTWNVNRLQRARQTLPETLSPPDIVLYQEDD